MDLEKIIDRPNQTKKQRRKAKRLKRKCRNKRRASEKKAAILADGPKKQRQVWYSVVCTKCGRTCKNLPNCFFQPLTFTNCQCGGSVVRAGVKISEPHIEEKPVEAFLGYFDGACAPKNPGGTGSYGAVFLAGDKSFTKHGITGSGPSISNNCAEYHGLEMLLTGILEANLPRGSKIAVQGDSMLVIRQMQGAWRVLSGLYMPWFRRAREAHCLLGDAGITITYSWIPRESNVQADALSNLALDEAGVEKWSKAGRLA